MASEDKPEQPALGAVGDKANIEAAIAKTLADFEVKGNDVRLDEATRRGWAFACMMVRNLAAPPISPALGAEPVAHLRDTKSMGLVVMQPDDIAFYDTPEQRALGREPFAVYRHPPIATKPDFYLTKAALRNFKAGTEPENHVLLRRDVGDGLRVACYTAPPVSPDVVALQAENTQMRALLEHYSNPKIYEPHPHGIAFDTRDKSYAARDLLSRLNAGEKK